MKKKKLTHFWDVDPLNGTVRKLAVRTQGKKRGWPIIEIDAERRVKAGSGFNYVYGFITRREALLWGIKHQMNARRWASSRIKKMKAQLRGKK